MAEANPFAAPAAPPAGGNPFDPFGSQPAATPQQGQFSSAPQAADPQARAAQYSASPYAPVQQPPAAQQAAYGQSPYGQQAPAYPPQPGMPGAPPPQQQQQPPPAAAAYGQGGYGASPYPPATENAVVVSQHQSNPYAGLVAAPPAPYGDSPSVTSATPSTGGNPFDPFAAAPPPPPAPAPQPAYPSYPQPSAGMPPTGQPPAEAMQGYAAPSQTAPPADQSNPFGDFLPSAPAPAPEPAPAPAPEPEPPRHEPISRSLREPPVPLHARPETDGPPAGGSPRNKYSNELAREAPPGASPLPKAELVRKKGYVLARISFRTIVIKKWKQAFWVQYGPHTMLWFRSEADFDDWLNNPYHNQSQRNFLIKLAVNFVHDLYKPNVRGYQVTQCRTKAYGSKMVRQFKLERWMDYGPTIAAAFGSYNPKEVDDLREALVECMRNTPLSGGIRATGAVRQPSREHQGNGHHGHHCHHSTSEPRHSHEEPPRSQPQPPMKEAADEPGEEADLLDVNNWDDVPSQASPQFADPTAFATAAPDVNPYAAAPAQAAYGAPAYQQQQQQQQPQQGYQNALVPAAGPPQAYPGAPPAASQQFGYPPAQQPQNPWGAPPPQQQPPQQQSPFSAGY